MHSNSVLFWVIKCQKFTLFPTGIPTLCKMYRTKDCRINKGGCKLSGVRGGGGVSEMLYILHLNKTLSAITNTPCHISYFILNLSSLVFTVWYSAWSFNTYRVSIPLHDIGHHVYRGTRYVKTKHDCWE